MVAADPPAGEGGVAGAPVFPSARGAGPPAGARAAGRDLIAAGLPPQGVVERLAAADPESTKRQVGIVDMRGAAASFSGRECFPWFGGLTGDHVAVQGNILVGEATVASMLQAFQTATGALAARLLAALKAGDRAGGDRRRKQ